MYWFPASHPINSKVLLLLFYESIFFPLISYHEEQLFLLRCLVLASHPVRMYKCIDLSRTANRSTLSLPCLFVEHFNYNIVKGYCGFFWPLMAKINYPSFKIFVFQQSIMLWTLLPSLFVSSSQLRIWYAHWQCYGLQGKKQKFFGSSRVDLGFKFIGFQVSLY